MNIVVTGGSGFIGRALTKHLQGRGHEVTVVDRVPSPTPGQRTYVGDLQEDTVVAAVVQPDVDAVIHLAATTSVLKSKENPQGVFDNNVAVTHALLERGRACGVRRFVFASTNAVVGARGEGLIDEDTPLAPLTPYGASKAAAEMLVNAYTASFGMQGANLRLTNVYGVGMESKDSVVARFVRALQQSRPVTIYGTGRQVRDFVYISDVCEAVERVLDSEYSGTVCIGYGKSYSVLELIDLLEQTAGRSTAREFTPPQQGEMPAVRVSVDKAARVLNWRPTTSLEAGLRRVWETFGSVHG